MVYIILNPLSRKYALKTMDLLLTEKTGESKIYWI